MTIHLQVGGQAKIPVRELLLGLKPHEKIIDEVIFHSS